MAHQEHTAPAATGAFVCTEATVTTTYAEFVAAKADFTRTYGFHVDPADIHPALMPHQRDLVV